MGKQRAGRVYLRLLEEFEGFDEELGRVVGGLYELMPLLPRTERERVGRFLDELFQGKRSLREARALLGELGSRYGGAVAVRRGAASLSS